MKSLFIVVVFLLGMSGCASKEHNPNGSYERANAASEKAHQGLERE